MPGTLVFLDYKGGDSREMFHNRMAQAARYANWMLQQGTANPLYILDGQGKRVWSATEGCEALKELMEQELDTPKATPYPAWGSF